MKTRPSKTTEADSPNPTRAPEPPGAPEPSALPQADATLTLSDEQVAALHHERVMRDLQVKTRACLNRAERERLKSYRLAWRNYWPLLPLLLLTWLLGALCMMPRYFRPEAAILVGKEEAALERKQQLSQLEGHLEKLAQEESGLTASEELRQLLNRPATRPGLVARWLQRLQEGVRPDALPDSLAELTAEAPERLLVVAEGTWEHGTIYSYADTQFPPTLAEAVAQVAQEFCLSHHQSELNDEVAEALLSSCQPSFQYSEELTREFAMRSPRTSVRVSYRAPLLGQEPLLHPIYQPNSMSWKFFTRKNFQRALRNHSFAFATLVLLAFLLLYSVVIYFNYRDQRIELRRFVLLGLLLCLEFLAVSACAGYISTQHEIPLSLLLSCLPLAFFPAIICNLLDERLALINATLMAMLLPLQLNLPSEHFPLFFFTLLVTLAAVLCFRNISRRLEFLSRGLLFGLVLAAAEVLFLASEPVTLSHKDYLIEIVFLLAGGLANGMLNGCLCILCMSVLEVLFQLPTAMSLTEVSNLDSPLMERLRQEAPGTYEHSIAVADLAVAGARTIGANAKLAYAMALYHDIGKLYSPDHFTENLQEGESSPHLRHSPEDSCEYLREHARFGLRLARKYHLPALIYPAILQHHGNSIMASFYNQACRQAAEKGLPPPAQEAFRYDQQAPASREVALIMMADSCEAATRSITHRKRDSKAEAQQLTEAAKAHPDATAEELAQTYEKLLNEQEAGTQDNLRESLTARAKSVIQGKFNDGQFDHVDLTTRQLAKLTETFVATLLDKNHTRVEYKK